MKTLRSDMSQGVNAVTDRRLIPDGFAVIADNVDVRSGSARPFRIPEYQQAAPPNTVRAFQYRSKWYYSSLYRRYAAELVGEQERIYFAEEGLGHSVPQKIVNGVQAPLGTMVPLAAPSVKPSNSIVPMNVQAVFSTTSGNLTTGTYSYRVSAIIDGNIMPASGAVYVVVTGIVPGQVTLTWLPVENATGYVIYGRSAGSEQTLITLGVATSWIDVGGFSPNGAFASNYDNENPVTYVYTYVRKVGPMEDESGPSPVSITSNPVNGRMVTRLMSSDGFYTNADSYVNSTSTASSIFKNLGGFIVKSNNTILTLDSVPSPAWVNGQEIVLIGNTGSRLPANDQFELSVPTAIPTPSAPIPGTETGTTGLPAGTYIWKITAIRGQTTGLLGGVEPAETIASSSSISKTILSPKNIPLSWTTLSGTDGYRIYRSADAGTTWDRVITITGQSNSYVDTGSNEATGVTPPVTDATGTRVIVLTNINLNSYNPTDTPYKVYLAQTTITTSINTIVDGDAVLISGASQTALNGTHKATIIDNTSFTIPVFTGLNGTISSILDVPNNNFITSWRLYRLGGTGSDFLFVAEIPIEVSEYADVIPVYALGYTLPTSYTDNQGAVVIFAPPPSDAIAPTLYNGMLFMIHGNSVIWGPTGIPDAFPVAYSKSFEHRPLALWNFAGGLIILCENGLYRADGFDSSTIEFQITRANDGCIAPYSVQTVGNYLVYLAKRGIMRFDGQSSECVTEDVIPYKLIISPSDYTEPHMGQDFYWRTTDHTASYGALLAASRSPIPSIDTIAYTVSQDVPLDGPIYNVAAFAWQNKYFLYFKDDLNQGDFSFNDPPIDPDLGYISGGAGNIVGVPIPLSITDAINITGNLSGTLTSSSSHLSGDDYWSIVINNIDVTDNGDYSISGMITYSGTTDFFTESVYTITCTLGPRVHTFVLVLDYIPI